MGRNLKIVLSIVFAVSLFGFYYFGIPAVLNVSKNKVFYEQLTEKISGFKILLKNPKIKMGFMEIQLSDENFAIINDDGSKALNIINPCINIKLLPLIFKKISIKSFNADKLDAGLVFDRDLKLKLGQYSIADLPESPFRLYKISANLKDYNIYLDDRTKNKKINFDGESLLINEFIENKRISISTEARLYSKKVSDIKINCDLKLPFNHISENQIMLSGYLKNLDISDYSDYAKSLSKGKIKSISGIINADAQTIAENSKRKQIKTNIFADNLSLLQEDVETSIYSKGRLIVNSDVSTIKNGFEINAIKISGKNINASVSGKVSSLNNKIPNLDVNVAVDNTKAENVIALLPGNHDLVPDVDLFVLKQAGFWGDATADLKIKGKANYPNVYGDVLIKNAYMVKPIPNAQKATIKLMFKGGYFDLDVFVPTSPTQKVIVKGPINIDAEKAADLHITSTDNVDLKTAQIVLNPLHRILHFDLGPVPIMDIKGKGGIDLRVKGTKENPFAWGEFFFKNGTVSFLDIHNMEISNASGALKFDNQNTYFENKTGILNGSPVSVKGSCSLLGNLNFDVSSKNQDIGKLLKTVQTSPMLIDIQELVKPIESASGLANIKFNLKGTVKDVNDIVFNKNLFAKGTIELLSDTFKIKDVPISISGTSGIVNFNNLDADFDIKTHYGKSMIVTEGTIKNDICNAQFSSKNFNIGEGLKTISSNLPYIKDLSTITTSFEGKYNGKIDNAEYDKLSLKGKIFSNKGSKSSIIVNNADYELSNSNFKLPSLNGKFNNSPYNLSLNISKIFSKNMVVNGYGKINSFNLSILSNKALQKFMPKNIASHLNDIEFINGNINISAKAKNNNYNLFSRLDDIEFIYKPADTKLIFSSGDIFLQNDTLNLNKINARIGQMPLFLNGKIYNINKNPNLNVYANIKPTQDFVDQFFNKNSIYPIKLKGDSIISSKISGTLKNINAKSTVDIKENSSFYYMGAKIGDAENPVKIFIDSTLMSDRIKLNNLKYDKIILSQNNKPFVKTQLNASGTLYLLKDNVYGFNNFKIKTENPTDAKIFNILFRKPFMKQGIFSSDLILNGTSENPEIVGKLDVTSIDMPFFDSTIRDINFDFKPDKISLSSKGKVLTNDVIIEAIIKNKLTPPYIVSNLSVHMADLNINKITDALRDMEAEATRIISSSNQNVTFDISQLIINNAEIFADKIKVRNIDAENFVANLKITDRHLVNVNKFKFNVAQGSVIGNLRYDIPSKKSYLSVHLSDANALIMSEALFDLKGQVYGSVNGDFNLSCNGDTNDVCFKTLSGAGNFKIADGKMPKLGSLEYLLKAGNIIKSGLAGISINSLIDLVTPLKTGEFESISGDIHIENGIADKVNVYSKGHDLNMYMTGSYDIVSSVADMKIFGSLSKNITTVLGKIKNASLTTLFNTIPKINDTKEEIMLQEEISKIPNIKEVTDVYRIFAVDVNGDINGTDYVRSFKWVK